MSIKRKGACTLIAALLISGVVSAGALTVYAEPEDETYEEPDTAYTDPDYTEPDDTEPDYTEPDYTEPDTETGETDYTEPDTDETDYTDTETDTGSEGYDDGGDNTDYDTDTGSDYNTDDGTDYDYDYPDYYTPETVYDNDWNTDYSVNQDYQLDQNNATSRLDTDVSVDTSELTSSDWEAIQKSINASAPAKANTDALDFAELKKNRDDGTLHNDNWIFLTVGILLLLVGGGLIAAVIILSVRASQAEKAEEVINLHTAAPQKKAAPARPRSAATAQKGTTLKTAESPRKTKKDLGDTLTEPLEINFKNNNGK